MSARTADRRGRPGSAGRWSGDVARRSGGADEAPAEALERARTLLADARRVVVLTGAGVSAESGVPTYRDDGGLWRNHRPQDLATPEAFRRDSRLVWEWYGHRRRQVLECAPNPAHRALARWVLDDPRSRLVVTQNVDGLHTRALSETTETSEVPAASRPVELHGSLIRVRCTACSHAAEDRSEVDARAAFTLPHCPVCHALLRPAVVWYGEALPPGVVDRAFRAAAAADLCLVVGTSATVHPAASLPLATRREGGRLVEVNPVATPLSARVDVSIRGPAGEILPALLG